MSGSKNKNVEIKPIIYVLFVFDLDGECKFIKNKTTWLLRKCVQFFFSVNRIFFCSSNQGGSQEHISCGVLIMSVSAVLPEKSRGNKMCDEDEEEEE